MKHDYDLLVIGSGSAGFSAAEAARGTGRKIGIVEAAELGGECPNWACVPTKTLLRSAKAYASLKEFPALGIDVIDASMTFEAIMERKRKIVAAMTGPRVEQVAQKLGIEIVRGHATFVDPHTIHVDGREITAARFVIAAGTKTRVPPIPGIESTTWLSFKDAVSLERRPESMIIVGGGPVGCEFATLFGIVKTQVTLLQSAARILPREEPEISARALERLEALGVTAHMQAEIVRVNASTQGVVVTVRLGRELKTLEAQHLLLATGKTANTGGLGCVAAGVKLDAFGTIETNTELRTSQKHIWAAGDINGSMQFTHTAHYEGALAGHNAFAAKPRRVDMRVVPRVTFVDPEVASVGMTEAQAKERAGAVATGTFDLRGLGRAYVDAHRFGFIKLVAEAKTYKVLGGHMIGERAGEVIHEVALAMYAKLTLDDLAGMIHAYPTYSEAVSAAASVALHGSS